MTAEEFNAWIVEYFTAFPDAREWLVRSSDRQEQRQATLKVWRDVLADTEVDECRLVTMLMSAGDLPAIPAYERDQTPAIIRRHVKAARERRSTRTTSSDPPELFYATPKRSAFSCVEALRGVLHDIASGMSREDAREKWLPDDPTEDQPRYRCLTCRDTGLVGVWSVPAMIGAERGTLKRSGHNYAAVRCTCSAGGKTSLVNLAAYHKDRWLIYRHGDWEQESAQLVEFMSTYKSKAASRMDNYEPGFDNF